MENGNLCFGNKQVNEQTEKTKQTSKDKLNRVARNIGLFLISINLLVVYRESVNLIGYITRRLSADSQQL